MTQLEKELQAVKSEVINMWSLVQMQLTKAKKAMLQFDQDLAREVLLKEKRVNAYELKIDRDCENIFALFSPVANDLRFLLAAIKINSNMERIGDIAEGIAKYILEFGSPFDKHILDKTQLLVMYDEAINMLADTRAAFENEDTILARSVFKKDEKLDEINLAANSNIASCIHENMESMNEALYVLSIIRKMERVGDQVKNIAEEIIFFMEAKVLKHQEEL
jgi:phosphate transport system protein